MNLRFWKRTPKALPAAPSPSSATLPSEYLSATSLQTGLTYYQLVDAYQSWVQICVNKIATTVATLPLRLLAYQKGGKYISGPEVKSRLSGQFETKSEARRWLKSKGIEQVEVLEHPVLDLLRRPNHYQSRYQLWYDTLVKLELGGQCGWYVVSAAGVPGEMYPLPLTRSAVLSRIPDAKTIVAGYRYQDGQIDQRFTMDEVIYFGYPSPVSPFETMSALKAQGYPYDIDHYMMELQSYIFKNKATPGFGLTTEAKLNQKQVDDIIAQINSQFQGAKNAGKPMILHSGLDVSKSFSFPLKELILDVVAQSVQDKMLSAFGVPAGKVGLVKDVNRANMEALDKTFYTETIRPKVMMIEERIELDLLPRYDERLTCDFDLPEITERTLDLQERRENITSGYTTINEERSEEGLDPVDWGDAPWLPAGLMQPDMMAAAADTAAQQAQAASDLAAQNLSNVNANQGCGAASPADGTAPADGSGGATGESATKSFSPATWTKERKAQYWKAHVQRTAGYERMYRRACAKLWRAQAAHVLRLWEEQAPKMKAHTNGWSLTKVREWLKATDATSGVNLDKRKEVERTKAVFEPVLGYVYEDAGQHRVDELKRGHKAAQVTVEFNVNAREAQRWLGTRLERFSEEVTGTTFDAIKAVLREGYGEGASTSTIADLLRSTFADFEKGRAAAISRTEANSAANAADLEGVQQMGMAGVLRKTWISSRDDSTRDTHLAAEDDYAEGIGLEEKFSVGIDSMQAPGMGLVGEENINCRCVLGYVEAK
jgi:HK97 family phage portal protein